MALNPASIDARDEFKESEREACMTLTDAHVDRLSSGEKQREQRAERGGRAVCASTSFFEPPLGCLTLTLNGNGSRRGPLGSRLLL